jgi:hypothetical protein
MAPPRTISNGLTRMLRKSKQLLPVYPLAGSWHRLLLGLSLLLIAAACSTTPNNIGVGLPTADANTGAYLVDTLTIRASTVLRDSIITSSSNSLFVGRYNDPQLGIITAKSYVSFRLASLFTPDQSQIADSLVLVLKPLPVSSSNPYARYGDTTKLQTLVDVRRLNSFVPTTQYGYASPKLTPMSGRVGATSVNENITLQKRRARPNLSNLRIRLNPSFRDELMRAGKSRQLSSQEQLDALYPGLALLPAADDNAALVQFGAATDGAALILYYHDPTDPSTAISYSLDLATGRHFYQAEADRSAIAGLNTFTTSTTSLSAIDASRTTQQVYIQGLLGLVTKLEIPYLTNLRSFGKNLIITNAVMTAEVPTTTMGTNLTPPSPLALYTTDQSNRLGAVISQTTIRSAPGSGNTATNAFDYLADVTSLDGFNEGGYTWSVLQYCQAVVNNQVQNNGLLLNTTAPTLPNRVVLGGPLRSTNKMRLRLYLISND